jgi:Galactose oxidase, central domain
MSRAKQSVAVAGSVMPVKGRSVRTRPTCLTRTRLPGRLTQLADVGLVILAVVIAAGCSLQGGGTSSVAPSRLPGPTSGIGTPSAAATSRTSAMATDSKPTPTRPGFSATGRMSVARVGHTATLLADGRVLIAGGYDGSAVLASAELYDPATGTFSPTGSMTVSREGHTATLLADGRVLVAGGYSNLGDAVPVSAELYDPVRGTFTRTGSMARPHSVGTATLLLNGEVLIAGGIDPAAPEQAGFTAAEVYNPATGKFRTTGSMTQGRYGQAATLLADGRVLIAGGAGRPSDLASAELYDPNSGRFAATGSMGQARYGLTATRLSDGRILVAGGSYERGTVASAELFDPKTGRFAATASMQQSRSNHTATLLADGRVLLAGGAQNLVGPTGPSDVLSSAETYDPQTGRFSDAGVMTQARQYQTATLLRDGTVLVVGGYGDADQQVAEASAEVWRP